MAKKTRKTNIDKLLKNVPAGVPSTDADLKALSSLRSIGEAFARVFVLSKRYNALGLEMKWNGFVCSVFECKPWNCPSLGDATEEQFAKLEAAVAAAEAK